MLRSRMIIIALVAALIVTAGVRADMMPVSGVDAASKSLVQICQEDSPQSANADAPLIGPPFSDLDLQPVMPWPPTSADVESAGSPQATLRLLNDERPSLDLCLYAFMGLGLCKTAPWVKKLHVRVIPDWYHADGPAQIGHSYAIEPNCLCSTAVCFVQPDCSAEDLIPQRRLGIIASLWCASQFTPSGLASRAPPLA